MISSDSVTLSINDIQRLESLLTRAELGQGGDLPPHLSSLSQRMEVCLETEPTSVPADVVTMNSRVRLQDIEGGSEFEYELVFPRSASPEEGRISVLTPLGAALIGARVGESIEVSTPRTTRRLKVVELVFQPEAAGRYDL